jgi:phosphohistidine phosphatase
MKLLFLRHAIAEDAQPGMRDWDRALTDEGRAQMPIVANALTLLGTTPDLILSSPLVRARETAEMVASRFGCSIDMVNELQPDGGTLEDLQRVLHHYDVQTVMLVGHEPDLSSHAARLVNADERGILLRKAGLIRIDIDGRLQAGRGRMVWLLTPRVMGCMTAAQNTPA